MTGGLAGFAVVTGASSGIGRAVACELTSRGMRVLATGRDGARLDELRRERDVESCETDLAVDGGVERLAACVAASSEGVDVLVHAAGELRLGTIESDGWDDLDQQYRVNLRAPYLVTKALLPRLKASRGQIVFVNSTAALAAGADNGTYAATKAGLRALAGSIRDQVNPFGVRVLSVYPGRTAGRMQELVHRYERRQYDPRELVQPCDVAELIAGALALPRTAEVTEIMLRPMRKPAAR